MPEAASFSGGGKPQGVRHRSTWGCSFGLGPTGTGGPLQLAGQPGNSWAPVDLTGPFPASLKVSERLSQPGVAIGLAWTPLGGEIMFVEASRMDGEGQLTLTGQLGDVMKESAHLAISWLRSNAKKYHLTNGE